MAKMKYWEIQARSDGGMNESRVKQGQLRAQD